MTSVAQVGRCLKYILEERADVLARQTGCIKRQRKFSGADLAQLLVGSGTNKQDMRESEGQ